MSFRAELIQVAAVAVAIVEDLDTGVGANLSRYQSILAEVQAERFHQKAKWGDQHHDDLSVWLAVLAEEVGEAARELDPDTEYGRALVDLLSDSESVARWILKHHGGGA